MNECERLNPRTLKALFHRLVRAVGSQEAAAHYLGVSRQYVGYLASANPEYAAYVPTWDHVWTLENACKRSVVFAELARMVEPPKVQADACPVKETHDVVRAAADMLPLADQLDPAKPETVTAFLEGLNRLESEAVECGAVANNITSMNKRRA